MTGTVLSDGQWHRARPLSILVDGWIAMLAIVGFIISQIPQFEGDDFSLIELAQRYPLFALAALFIFISPALRWYSTHFQVDQEYVRVKTGIFNKKQSQARINRIQSIDIVQPFMGRIVGLARLDFDVADSGSEMLQVRYVPKAEAAALRAEILLRAGRISPSQVAEAEESGDLSELSETSTTEERTELARLPLWMVIILSVGTVDMFLFGLGILGSTFGIFISPLGDSGTSFLVVLPLVLGVVSILIPRINRYANFVLSWDGDGLRLSSGLTSTMDQTLPAGRIQAVRIKQNIVLRIFGLYQVEVNVAGFATDASSATGSVNRSRILPAGRWEQVERVLPLVLPDVPAESLPTVANQLMHQDERLPLATAGTKAILHAPFAWRRMGAGISEGMFLSRDGWLNRNADLVSLNRLQCVFVSQGPIQRLLGTCSLRSDVPLGLVRPGVRHILLPDAAGLMHYALSTANFARRYSDRQEWMGSQELAEFNRRTEELVHD